MRFYFRPIFILLLMLGIVLPGTILASTPLPSTTTLTLSSSTVSIGTAVTLTATVTSSGRAVTPGVVVFCNATAKYCEDLAVLGQAQLTSSGTATLKLILSPGTHNIKAVFQKTNLYTASNSSVQSVEVTGKYGPSTTISAAGQPGSYSLTGTVASFGIPSATGTVIFPDKTNNNVSLGSAQLGPGAPGLLLLNSTSLTENGIAAVGDFNQDGRLDEVVFHGGISIMLGNGDGTFTRKSSPAIGTNPKATANAVTVGDFNGDGILDLAATNSGDSTIYILLGKGDGTFAAGSSISTLTPSTNSDFAVSDFNGDGNADLAVASGTQLEILLGNGDGTFAPLAVQTIPSVSQITVSDFNGDGKSDLLIASVDADTAAILLGNGDGTFTGHSSEVSCSVSCGTVADFNGDGKPDLVMLSPEYCQLDQCTPGFIYINLGQGDGTFVLETGFTTPLQDPANAAIGDFNGDGIVDLVVGDGSFYENKSTFNTEIFLGAGDGTFVQQNGPTITSNSLPIPGDFNGDGKTDLAFVDYLTSSTSLTGNPAPATALSGVLASATVNNISIGGSLGIHNVFAQYLGDKDHSQNSSTTIPLQGPQATTTVALEATPPKVSWGQTVQFVATISPSSAEGHSPTGTVSFFNGTNQIGSSPVSNGKALFSIMLPVGSQNLTASYSGDIDFAPSTSPVLTVTVSTARSTPTETRLHVSPSSFVSAGDEVTLTARVDPGDEQEGADSRHLIGPGEVIFCDADAAHCEDKAVLGIAQLINNGTATLRLRPSIGQHQFKAIFQGAKQYAGSSSEARTVSVAGLYPTYTGIDWCHDGLISTVSSHGQYIPTGVVSFLDATTGMSLGTAELKGNAIPFTPEKAASLKLSSAQNFVATADFNGDGIPDIATINNDGTASVLLGKGNGSFVTQSTITADNNGGLVVGDFNRDGIQDVAVTQSGHLAVFLGNGDGSFTAKPIGSQNFGAVMETADFNGDGLPDLVAGSTNGDFGVGIILLGNGDGTFTVNGTFGLFPEFTTSSVIGDFNRDGVPDVAVAWSDAGAGSVSIMLGNGDGTFSFGPMYFIGINPSSIVSGDFNGDGILDLAETGAIEDSNGNYLNGTVTILLGNGDGTFNTSSTLSVGTTYFPKDVVMGDFNGDGITDLATLNQNTNNALPGTLMTFFGRGDGTFTSITKNLDSTTGFLPVVGDWNHDAISDLAIGNYATNAVEIWISTAEATAEIKNVKIPGSGKQSVYASYPGDKYHASSVSGSISISPPVK